MLKNAFSAALFVAAIPALAQPATSPPPANTTAQRSQRPTPPPAFMQAAQAFGQCVEGATDGLPATVAPEAAAAQALTACAAQRTAIETQFDIWISSAEFPPDRRDAAREQFRAQFGQAGGRIAAAIRERRAGGTPEN